MLLFSTVLSIKDSLNVNDFIELVIDWNQNSTHKENVIPNLKWSGEHNIRYGDEKLWLDIQEYRNENIVAVRYEKAESDGAVWDTDFVMNFNDMKMSIRLDRGFAADAKSIDSKFSSPFFIKLLIEKGYVNDDLDLPITGDPVIIEDNEIDKIANVINGKTEYKLPIVFVSKTYNGENPVDVNRLAYLLKGVAHVLVQKGGWQNSDLREKCLGNNEYHGAVGVYFPNKAKHNRRWYYREYGNRNKRVMDSIAQSVINYSNSQMVGTLDTWTGVNNALLRDRLLSQKGKRLEAEIQQAEANELVDSVDGELKKYKTEIANLTRANDKLAYENQILKAKIDAAENNPAICLGNEDEYFPGEISDMILNALREYLKSVKENTREYDVLNDILDNNDYIGTSKNRADKLKNALNGYNNVNAALKRLLEDCGFTITEDGKHYKLIYYGDARYCTTIAKTPSDGRTGKNVAATIIRDML